MHKPWIAAILNLILPGAGYLYNGRRIFLGIVLGLSSLGFYSLMFDSTPSSQSSQPWDFLIVLSLLLLGIAFSYDAYSDAVKIQSEKQLS